MQGKPEEHFIYKQQTDLDCKQIIQFLEEKGNWADSITIGEQMRHMRRSKECHLLLDRFHGVDHSQLIMHLKNIHAVTEEHLRNYLKKYKAFCTIEKDENWRCLKYDKKDNYKAHADDGPGYYRRISVLIYLNDDYKGGELYFPYQDITLKPNAGDIVFFPSTFTHVHQAMPVKKGTKYVLVSWLA